MFQAIVGIGVGFVKFIGWIFSLPTPVVVGSLIILGGIYLIQKTTGN